MKIAFIATYDFAIPGGVKNHICNLSQELSRLGHEVSIIAPSSTPVLSTEIPNFIQAAPFPSAAKTGPIPPHFLITPKVVGRIKQLLDAENFDIVHIHEPLIPPICLAATRYKNAPLFATFHTYYEQGQPLYRLLKPFFNACLKTLSGRIAVSEPARNYIEQYFPYDYKIIPNGIHLEKLLHPTSAHPQVFPEYINLLFVGHAQFKRKGLRYLLAAFRLLKNQFPNLRLLIAGTKWAGRNCPPELDHSDLKDIVYLGTVSDAELISLYQSADIFCAPSTGRESFGIVLLEAMAAGIPIVTTQIDGYSTVVSNEQEAIMVPPKNSQALAEGIKKLILDPELRKTLVAQARSRVQRYSWKIVAQEILTYYQQQLSSQ